MILAMVLGAAWGIALATPLLAHVRVVPPRLRTVALRGAAGRRPTRTPLRAWSGPIAARFGARATRFCSQVWARMRRRERSRAVERAVPLALDVLTMAARAGYTPRLAIAAAARWSPPAIGTVLAAVEHRCRLGASLADALDDVGTDEPAVRGLTDAVAVAERSGAPIADLLARLADDARATVRRRSEAHARRVPVRLLFPLVFLVLPAFGLLTVVPALAAGLRNS